MGLEQMLILLDHLQRRNSQVAPEPSFSVDQSTGRPISKITYPVTKKVILRG